MRCSLALVSASLKISTLQSKKTLFSWQSRTQRNNGGESGDWLPLTRLTRLIAATTGVD